MSLYPFYKPYAEVNDFYESIQGGSDSNEDFGKHVSNYSTSKGFKKTYSYKNLTEMASCEDGRLRSYSNSNIIAKNYENNNVYTNSTFGYKLEDHTTMGSFSPSCDSVTSCSTLPSTTSFVFSPSRAGLSSKLTSNGSSSSISQNAPGQKSKKNKIKASKKKQTAEVSFRQKYKTEVCKYWAEKGHCNFGEQCAFAHGSVEMRQKSHISNNYKTKKCNQFHETGYCPYGIRCQFVHNIPKENTTVVSGCNPPNYSEVLENPELYLAHDPDCMCTHKKGRSRLPSFQNSTHSNSDIENHETDLNNSSENSLESL